jgi:hypothetical protein
MRARALLFASLPVGAFLYACGTDNGNQSFGPVYTLDGGGTKADGAGGGNPDGSTGDVDGASPSDGGGESEGGGSNEGGMDASSCTNVVAVVGGSASAAFGAIYKQGAWKAASLGTSIMGDAGADSPPGQSLPAVASLGTQFLTVMRTTNDQLVSSTWSAGVWSQAAPIATAAARDTPSLAVLSGKAHLVYQGIDYKFLHGTFATGAWDGANDPVGGAGASQAFGPTTPGAAAVGTDIVCAFSGDSTTGTGGLYDIAWSPASDGGVGTWGVATSHPAPLSYFRANPAIVAIPSGQLDALVVYVDTATSQIQWTGRVQSNKTYTAPAVVDTNARSDVGLSLALMANGKFALVYWGQNQEPYFSIGTQTGQSLAWSVPAPLVSATNPTLPSPPVVAPGVCGDDAVAAYALGGSAYVTRLRGSSWSTPETVTGVTGAANVGIATH